MSNIEYYENVDLPEIPAHLVASLDDIVARENLFKGGPGVTAEMYAAYACDTELVDYIQCNFDFPIIAQYQLVRSDLKIHIDRGNLFKYTYYVTLGGPNAQTLWHSADVATSRQNPEIIVDRLPGEKNKWYKIRVDYPHSVGGITEPRLSICVTDAETKKAYRKSAIETHPWRSRNISSGPYE